MAAGREHGGAIYIVFPGSWEKDEEGGGTRNMQPCIVHCSSRLQMPLGAWRARSRSRPAPQGRLQQLFPPGWARPASLRCSSGWPAGRSPQGARSLGTAPWKLPKLERWSRVGMSLPGQGHGAVSRLHGRVIAGEDGAECVERRMGTRASFLACRAHLAHGPLQRRGEFGFEIPGHAVWLSQGPP